MRIFRAIPCGSKQLNDDPLTLHESQPVQTVAAFARAGERLTREFDRITLPVLILHGTADKATRPDGSRMFFERAGSADRTLKLYDGHFHDLLNDYGREQVMGDIIAWIDERIGAARREPAAMADPQVEPGRIGLVEQFLEEALAALVRLVTVMALVGIGLLAPRCLRGGAGAVAGAAGLRAAVASALRSMILSSSPRSSQTPRHVGQ